MNRSIKGVPTLFGIIHKKAQHNQFLIKSFSSLIQNDNINTTPPASSTASSTPTQRKIRHTKKEAVKMVPHNLHVAIDKLREQSWAKFDETIDIAVNLGVDPRKPNQSIKVR